MTDQPTPEQAVAAGVMSVADALVVARTRKQMMEDYIPTVDNPEGYRPYADRFLELNDQSIALLESIDEPPDEVTRDDLEEMGKTLTRAATEMVQHQVDTNNWHTPSQEELEARWGPGYIPEEN